MRFIKIILFVTLFFTLSHSYSRRIDSLLIESKSFLQYININRTEIHTLEYQLYIIDMIPLMDKHQFDVRSALVLPENLTKKYLKELRRQQEFNKMKDLMSLQRYATGDNTVYGEELIDLFLLLGRNKDAYLELKNMLIANKISYKKAKQISKNVQVSEKFIKREFDKYIPGSKSYNQFYFGLMVEHNPLQSLMILSSLMEVDKEFLSKELVQLLDKINNKIVMTQVYGVVYNRLGESIQYDILLQLEDIDQLTKVYDSLSYKQKVSFADILVLDMIKEGKFNDISHYINTIKTGDYTPFIVRYEVAKRYRNGESIYQYADSITLNKKVASNFLYEVAIFQLFDKSKTKSHNIIAKYKKLATSYDEKSRFVIWKNLYETLNSRTKKDIYKMLQASVILDIKKFKEYATKLKKKSIEQKILISFIETNYYKVQYSAKELHEWYGSLQFLDDGELIMLSSEIFFTKEDLRAFYLEQLDIEHSEKWKSFLDSRLSE